MANNGMATVQVDPSPPSYEMAVKETTVSPDPNYNKPDAPVNHPSAPPSTSYILQPPIHNGTPIMPVGQQARFAVNMCLHPNLGLSYEYDTCALVCMIILIFQFFPFGFYSLSCLDTIKNYRCPFCGYKQSRPKISFYIVFGMVQPIFISIAGFMVTALLSSIEHAG